MDATSVLRERRHASGTQRRYASSWRRYSTWATRAGLDPNLGETLAAWLHTRRDRSNRTLQVDVSGVAHHSASDPNPASAPVVGRYLTAHARYAGDAPDPGNTSAALELADVVALLVAPWPSTAPGGDLTIDRGAALVGLLHAAGPNAAASWAARVTTEDICDRQTHLEIRGPSGESVRVYPTNGCRCVVAALRRCASAAERAGTPHLLGWSADGGHVRSARRPLECLRPQLAGALSRAGLPPNTHPSDLDRSDLDHLLGHVDRSRRLELRTKAQVATWFNTAARHDDTRHVELPIQADEAKVTIWVSRSKADQSGTGHPLVIDHLPGHPPVCPACHLLRWVRELGAHGPLFPSLGAGGVIRTEPVSVDESNDALRRLAGANICPDGRLGTHSLRKTHDTLRAANGEEVDEIAETTHQSPGVVYRHYIGANRTHDLQAQIRVEGPAPVEVVPLPGR